MDKELTLKESLHFITMECTPETSNIICWNEGTSPEAVQERLTNEYLHHGMDYISVNHFVKWLLVEVFGDYKDLAFPYGQYPEEELREILFKKLTAYCQAINLLEVAADILDKANAPYGDQWDAIETTTKRIASIAKSLEPENV